MPSFPVLHHFLEFAQTHVHWVGDAIQPSHPLLPTSPPALNLSQRQGLFQWVSSSHQVAKVLELQLQHQSFRWKFRKWIFQIKIATSCTRDHHCHASAVVPRVWLGVGGSWLWGFASSVQFPLLLEAPVSWASLDLVEGRFSALAQALSQPRRNSQLFLRWFSKGWDIVLVLALWPLCYNLWSCGFWFSFEIFLLACCWQTSCLHTLTHTEFLHFLTESVQTHFIYTYWFIIPYSIRKS